MSGSRSSGSASDPASPSQAIAIAAFCLLAGATSWLRVVASEQRMAPVEVAIDVPPFPADVARPFSFGLRSLVADLTFLQSIQVYGARQPMTTWQAGLHEDRLLENLLTWSTDLDPKFVGAYRFAGNALPHATLDGKAAGVFATERLLERAVRERPEEWRFHFMLGFVQSFYLDRIAEAAAHLSAAAKLPGGPAYLGLLATRLAADAGNLDFAEQMAREMAAQANEESTRAEWEERLLSIQMERSLRVIDAAQARHQQRTGAPARTLEELVAAGELGPLPPEPHGGRWVLGPDGSPRSTAGERLRVRGRSGTQSGLEPK